MSSPKHDRDLILMEVLESNSIVWFIAFLVCKNFIRSKVREHLNLRQFDPSLFNEDFDRWIQWTGDSYYVFNF